MAELEVRPSACLSVLSDPIFQDRKPPTHRIVTRVELFSKCLWSAHCLPRRVSDAGEPKALFASLTFPKKQDRGFFSWPPARTPPSSGDDQTCIQGSTPKQRIQNRDPNSSSHVGEYRVPGSGRKYSPLEKAQGVDRTY